jgi:2,4-dienoyl-CoA reductase-like NADH-dependent reductase (Old Yellow Enzyme family)/thioredoxin reductase
MERYPHLFTPLDVGSMHVKNRIFMAPMSTHMATPEGRLTPEMTAYYETRARGGAGYLTVASVLIDRLSRYGTFRNVGLYDDGRAAELRTLTDAIHRHGTMVGAQLLHPSTAALAAYNEGRQPVAASPVGARAYQELPRELTQEEIGLYVQAFGQAARRAREAGFDAVELHCCHRHGLLGNFLSPLHNKRTDAYGGGVDGRLRMPLEVVAEVRRQAGEDFPILVRMSVTDGEEDGQSLPEGKYIARRLEEAGVAMLHLSNGTLDSPWKTAAPSGTPQAFNADLSAQVRGAVHIPVGVIGRINEPWVAEMVLAEGKADAAYIGRALICDPEFPEKARAGREAEIRPCIGCLRCLATVNSDGSMCCTMNPRAGRELALERQTLPAAGGRKVLVVGGGPAGLAAAAEAAELGCAVTLAERSHRLGGQMYLAGFPPCKHDVVKGTRYLIDRARAAGVRFQMDWDVSPQDAAGYDGVILTAGAEPVVPRFLQGAAQLVTAQDALEGKAPVGQNAVVVGGGPVGCETADYLIHPHRDLGVFSRRVTILEMDDYLEKNETTAARTLLVERLLAKGCRILTGAQVESVQGTELYYRRDGERCCIKGIDTVVAAIGTREDGRLAQALGALAIPVQTVHGTANIQLAVTGGFDAARALFAGV